LVSLTPDQAPSYQHSDDAGDTSNTLVTPHQNGLRSRLSRPVLPGGALARNGRLPKVSELEPSYNANNRRTEH
jgi:hypothetical protein